MLAEAREESGQSTLEYALVLFGFMGMLVVLGLAWRFIQGGGAVSIARDAGSHLLSGDSIAESVQDIVLF